MTELTKTIKRETRATVFENYQIGDRFTLDQYPNESYLITGFRDHWMDIIRTEKLRNGKVYEFIDCFHRVNIESWEQSGTIRRINNAENGQDKSSQ